MASILFFMVTRLLGGGNKVSCGCKLSYWWCNTPRKEIPFLFHVELPELYERGVRLGFVLGQGSAGLYYDWAFLSSGPAQ